MLKNRTILYPSALVMLLMAIAPSANAEVFSQNLNSQHSNSQNLIAQNPSSQTQSSNLDRGFKLVIDGREIFQRGDSNQALQLFQQALTIFKQEGDRLSEARTQNFIGNVY